MPEYHQIQWHIPTSKGPFWDILPSYSRLLKEVLMPDPMLDTWISELEWNEAENGFVYFDNAKVYQAQQEYLSLRVRPIVIGITPKIYTAITDPWIELGIVVESSHLYDESMIPQYAQSTLRAIWRMMDMCQNAFPLAPVFFTDEVQDGKPFEGIITENGDALWKHELAIFPKDFGNITQNKPVNYKTTSTEGRIFSVNTSSIVTPPWQG